MKRVVASVLTLVAGGASGALAQVPLDRADPGIATRDQPPPNRQLPKPAPDVRAATAGVGAIALPGTPVARMIVVDGARHFAPADFATATVSGVARAAGYLFAHSTLPPQTLADGVLHVRLDEGHLDEIRLAGAQDAAVRAILQPLVGHAPTRAEVERRLALASDLPGVALGRAEFRQEGERGVLVVPVGRDRVQASALVDNRGFRELGPVRAQLSANFNGVLGDRDALTLAALDTPAHPDELVVLTGRYAVRPDQAGTEIALTGSWARTRPGDELARFHIAGQSGIEGLAVSRPLLRRNDASVWLSAGFDHLPIDQRVASVLARRDRLATVNLALRGTARVNGSGRLTAGAGVTRGLDILGATEAGDPRASRPEAGGVFTLFGAYATLSQPIAGPLSLQLSVNGQLATRPLLAVEQIQLGGSSYGRAYDFAERSGDKGVAGSAELDVALLSRQHGPLRQLTFYGFGDAGRVANLRNDLGTGSLFSAGTGLRATLLFRLQAGLEAAFPLNERRFATDSRAPRLSFYIARGF